MADIEIMIGGGGVRWWLFPYVSAFVAIIRIDVSYTDLHSVPYSELSILLNCEALELGKICFTVQYKIILV